MKKSATYTWLFWILISGLFLPAYPAIDQDLSFLFKELSQKVTPTKGAVLAVLPFEMQAQDLAKNSGVVVAEFGIGYFQKEGKFTVVDRANFKALVNEQELANSDLVEQEKAIQMGKLLTAQYLVTGVISTAFGKTNLSAKLLNTETGEVLSTSSKNIGVAKWDDFTKSILAEKSQWSASVLRSLVVPGWGQYYAGKPVRGTLSLVAGLGSFAYALFATVDASNANTEYSNAKNEVIANPGKWNSTAEQQAYVDEFRQSYNQKIDRQVLAWSLMGGVWVLNLIDAGIAGVQLKNQFKPYFSWSPEKKELQLVYQF